MPCPSVGLSAAVVPVLASALPRPTHSRSSGQNPGSVATCHAALQLPLTSLRRCLSPFVRSSPETQRLLPKASRLAAELSRLLQDDAHRTALAEALESVLADETRVLDRYEAALESPAAASIATR